MTNAHQKGQGLVELIIAISVITVGMFAVWSLALSSYTAEREAQLRFTGANLAREGVEIVKNIRDSNWLAVDENEACAEDPCHWNSGLAPGDYTIGSFLAAGSAASLVAVSGGINDAATQVYKLSDPDGKLSDFFANEKISVDDGATPFRRIATLRVICCTDSDGNRQCDDLNQEVWAVEDADQSCPSGEIQIGLDVTTRVTWLYNDQVRQSVVQDQLFNWR